MRGHYELTLSDGTKIPMRFCTWSLKRFCQLQKIGPSEIGEALSGTDVLDAIVNLLKSATEYEYELKGLTHNITEIEVCDWIDDIGGIGGKKFSEIMSALNDSMNSSLEEKTTKKSSKDVVKKN